METRFRGRPMKAHLSPAISALPPRLHSIGVRLPMRNQPICQQALQVRAQPAEVASQGVRPSWQSSVPQHDFSASPASFPFRRTPS